MTDWKKAREIVEQEEDASFGHGGDLDLVLAALEAGERAERERDAALAVLREVEWEGCDDWYECPVCEGYRPGEFEPGKSPLGRTEGHAPGCRLAAAIGVSDEQDADLALLDDCLTEAMAEDRLRGRLGMDGWQVFDLVTQRFLRRVERDPGPGDYAWDGVHFSFAEAEKGHERAFDPPRFF